MKPKTVTHKGPGRRPRQRQADGDTRAAILAAARRMFGLKGLDGTSIRDVAEAAGVNTAMLYYYFKDKEDLYLAVLADSFSAIAAIWNDEIFKSASSARDKIKRFIEGYIGFHRSNEDLRRIMAMEFAKSRGNMGRICEMYFADNFARLVQILKDGMRKGELKKTDPFMAAISLIGIIVHNFIMQPVAEHIRGRRVDLSPKKMGEFVASLFFNGLGREGRS